MNSSHFTTSPAPRTTTSRAHFSPIVRGRAAGASLRPASSVASMAASARASIATGSQRLGSLWASAVLDRLQPTLTRYHY